MKKIGIVGIGGISQKAYLPYMRQLSGIEWHVFTRKEEVREEVVALFGQAVSYDSLTTLLDADLDGVFIHAATVAHPEIAAQFLKKGIPVYMDKPVTEDFEETKALYDLAVANGTFLMAGFNRRFAPKVKVLAEAKHKRRILVEKNDVNSKGELQYKLFDFFIHPLDTALYLMDGKLLGGHFHYQLEDGMLTQVSVTLHTASESLVASMNLQSGSRREIMEVQTPEATYHLENLDELTIITGVDQTRENFGSWDTTLYKRGFETIIQAFLEAIETGNNPVSLESSLLSHWVCDQMNRSETPYGILDLEAFYGIAPADHS
ncbi:Gfo/Idh/MocA family protein [Streptococcus ovuberis]|uniref:Gfo/Idh/MocA family oxidoreductase n=1 Tax=Streptococcus ovuberis TaxID=1936207 RepID=A0A7X6RZX1_9STRE|nr:Gfo/Idh/MocA family oxidoreductase [Streptococcus ovuberis]NKZ19608.1 Gfo/Idh/MocA family oxidoreductase [Streptococcus ovuberis]